MRKLIEFPEVCKYWDYEKNIVSPTSITPQSNKCVYWKCEKNHSFKQRVKTYIKNRTCKCCSYHIACDDNNLTITHPEICDYWVDSLNPINYTFRSTQKIEWICQNGHKYTAKICKRVKKDCCPYCANKKVCKDNCLATTHPELCKEWGNNSFGPENYTYGSQKKVEWVCNHSHRWKASINSRVKGHGCPVCSGRVAGESNLSLFPNLCKEWNDKNNPSSFSIKSNYNALWKCKYGHEWRTKINVRTAGHGCPVCNGQRASKDNNIGLIPEFVKYWDYEKNVENIEDYLPNSNQKVWWKCENNHSFCLSIQCFNKRKFKCSKCHNQSISKTYNFAVCFPDLLEEWNDESDPYSYFPKSHKKVWWKCKNGHRWKASIKNRVFGAGCLKCSTNISNKCVEWLDSLNIEHREYKIGRYFVDGFKNNVIYEYFGNFWHGDPRHYNPKDGNRVSKKTYITLLYNTIKRLNKLSKNYTIIYRWEDEEVDKTYSYIHINKKELLKKAVEIYENKIDQDILEILC